MVTPHPPQLSAHEWNCHTVQYMPLKMKSKIQLPCICNNPESQIPSIISINRNKYRKWIFTSKSISFKVMVPREQGALKQRSSFFAPLFCVMLQTVLCIYNTRTHSHDNSLFSSFIYSIISLKCYFNGSCNREKRANKIHNTIHVFCYNLHLISCHH